MRSQIVLSLTVGLFSVALAACGGTAPANSNSGANKVNANTTNPLETKKTEPEKVTNNAPTLTPVFKAFCDAWAKNDEAALRRVYSSDTIKFFEDEMKKEKVKSLVKFLQATDKVSGDPCEVTNEKIDGDKALARIRSNRYPTGIEVVFVKENGEWKLTNGSPELYLKKPAANSNSAQ